MLRFWVGGYTPLSAIPCSFVNEFACDKPHYPFELPKGWCWCKLEDIASDLLYGTSEKSLSEGLVPVLRMGNINRIGEIDWNNLVYTSNQADIAKYSLKQDDLLFNRTNSAEWVGKTAIYKGNKNAIYAGYIIRIRTISVNADYINYVMNSSYHRAWCDEVKTDAVNQSNINAQKLSQFYIPIPPYKEQERIVNSVQRWTTFIDNIEKEKSNLAFSVTETKSKILDLAIHGKLVPQDPTDEPASELLKRINPKAEFTCDNPQYENLPNGWCECTLGSLFLFIRNGINIRQDKSKIGYPITRIETISSEFIDRSRMGYAAITEENYSDYYLQKDDILMSHINSPIHVGKCALCDIKAGEKIIHGMNLLCLRPYPDIEAKFILMVFRSAYFKNEIRPFIKNAVNQASINIRNLSSVHLYLPPVSEQHRIVAKIEELFTQLDKIEVSL